MSEEIFDRKYKLTISGAVQGTLKDLIITDLRVNFNVKNTDKVGANSATIDIDNLSRESRGQLATMGKLGADGKPPAIVTLEAGYETTGAQVLWVGDLVTSLSARNGSTWVTSLLSQSGADALKSRVNTSFGPKTPVTTIVRALLGAMGAGEGNLAQYANDLKFGKSGKLAKTGMVLFGSAKYHLTSITRASGMNWSIQNGAVQFAVDGLASYGRVTVLSPTTGLVGTPQAEADPEASVTVTAFILPGLTVGATVRVQDVMSDGVNGEYRIKSLSYVGDTRGASWHAKMQCRQSKKIA